MTAAAVNSVQVEALRFMLDQLDALAAKVALHATAQKVDGLAVTCGCILTKQSPSARVAAERADLMAGEAARWLRMLEAELAAVRVGLLQDLQSAKGGAS